MAQPRKYLSSAEKQADYRRRKAAANVTSDRRASETKKYFGKATIKESATYQHPGPAKPPQNDRPASFLASNDINGGHTKALEDRVASVKGRVRPGLWAPAEPVKVVGPTVTECITAAEQSSKQERDDRKTILKMALGEDYTVHDVRTLLDSFRLTADEELIYLDIRFEDINRFTQNWICYNVRILSEIVPEGFACQHGRLWTEPCSPCTANIDPLTAKDWNVLLSRSGLGKWAGVHADWLGHRGKSDKIETIDAGIQRDKKGRRITASTAKLNFATGKRSISGKNSPDAFEKADLEGGGQQENSTRERNYAEGLDPADDPNTKFDSRVLPKELRNILSGKVSDSDETELVTEKILES